MKRSVRISARKKTALWASLALGALVLLALSPSLVHPAWAQAQGSAAPTAGQRGRGGRRGGGQQAQPASSAASDAGDAQEDQGNEDAGDEEMLTGQPSQPSAAQQRPLTAAETGPKAELSYITRLSRTAVWVGDPFHYDIIVDHSPNIQFVLQNLNKDTLIMEPLKVESVSYTSTPMSDGLTRLVVDIGLRSYTVGTAEQAIPQVTLFYFRKEGSGSASEGQAAQSVTIPGPSIGLRSTLPTEAADLRDAITVNGWARSRWVVAGIGWAALIVLVTGLGWEGAMMVRYRKGRKGPDPRKAMAAINDRWSQAVPMDFSDPERVQEFYGRSYTDLKEYLSYLLEAPTAGLTAEDVQSELGRLSAGPDVTERTARVLAACELARYGRNGKAVDVEQARNVAQDMREIFHIGSKA